MLQQGKVTPIQVTITLNRMFGGFWAFCPITLQLLLDGEVKEEYVVKTDAQGKVTFPFIPHRDNESLNISVRGQVLQNISLPVGSDSVSIPLTMA